MKESLDFIYAVQKELSTFGGIGALLGWDQMTYMPKMGAMERSEQIALISTLSHKRVISDEFWRHIQRLSKPENFDHLKEKDKIVVKRLRKDVEKARKIPSDFVERMARETTMAYQEWGEARKKNDFKIFLPHLTTIVELEKEYCSYIDLPGPRYNTLLDDYEEGMTVDRLEREFTLLKHELKKMLEKIKESSIFQRQKENNMRFSIEQQKKLCSSVIEKMNLPKERSRVDETTHPFTTSMGNDDVRITTNYERENPLFSFFSTVHEAGHALYELGLPRDEYKDTVISDSPSLGLHESQSRFWENMIAKNKHFWTYFYPQFKKIAPNQFAHTTLDEWYTHVNLVTPSLIRVEADELTYCLHVILRFEIETSLMDDKITVSELPQVWNEKMQELLGTAPSNDKEGVLQDMHWSGGSFGYFPTYAIGTMYAAQLFNKLSEEQPNMNSEIAHGNFTNVLQWLREHVHRYGRVMTADEIITKTCGEGLNSKVFTAYLKDKYYSIYGV